MQSHHFSIAASLGVVALVAACSADSTTPGASGASPVSVSFSTTPTSTASASLASSSGVSRSVTTTSGTNTLVITTAQVVVARMELAQASGSCTSTADAGDDHEDSKTCEDLELAPGVVNLPVDSTVASALNVTVPAGTYSALEAKIRPVVAGNGTPGAGTAAFLTAHPDLAGVSVRVQGTYNGKAFTFTASPRAEFETVFNPPIVVADKGANITVHVDLSTWFKASSGTLVDPSTATAGTANFELVSNNIRRSFRAFRDDSKTGKEDGSH